MDKLKTTLAFDLGKTTGWAVGYNEGIYAKGSFKITTLNHLFTQVKELVELYKPDIIVNCQGFTQSRKIARIYGAREGMLELVAERNNIAFVSENDRFIRKRCFSKGGLSKEEVCDILDMPYKDHDIADAMTAALYLFRMNDRNNV